MQYLIDTSPRSNPWTVSRMIGEIMAVWFSSVHQLAMVEFLLRCIVDSRLTFHVEQHVRN